MPGNILYNCCVASKYSFGIQDTILSGWCINIPQANGVVIRCREQMTIEVWIPWQAITLFLVPSQTLEWSSLVTILINLWLCGDYCIVKQNLPEVWVAFPTRIRTRWMFCVVKNQDIWRGCFSGNHTGILGHVASPVDFSFMIDLDLNFNLTTHRSKTSKLWWKKKIYKCVTGLPHQVFTSFIIIIMRGIKLSILIRKLDRGNQQVILFVTGMGTKDKSMNWVVFAFRPGVKWNARRLKMYAKIVINGNRPCNIRKPLGCKWWPFERMCHNQIIQKRGILLPDFVFLVDDAFLHCFIKRL